MRRPPDLLVAIVITVALLGACSDGDDDPTSADPGTSPSSTTATTTPEEPLRILLSNDDGIAAPGLDLLARSLQAMDDVEVTVVAPAEDQSGSSDNTTPGGAPYEAGRTAGGTEGTAVAGEPADAVGVVLDELGLEPHVIVSGINSGQNIGPLAAASGTVGVVRTGLRRGIPGVAASAGLTYDEAQFEVAAELVVAWLTEHRADLVAGTFTTDGAFSFNVPACDPAEMGDLVEVPRAEDFPEGDGDPFGSDCTLGDPAPADDVAALRSGYPSLAEVPADL